jgi:competence CoiA-like predicted nuclease
MLFATVNGEKVEAVPKTTGTCPLCERTVFSKCGEINVWHWAHRKDESCDSWYEPETEWHKNWKLTFGKDNCEIVISKDGIRHIADIFTNDSVVIELQNSPIQKPIIRRRENFYGERMLWVINGKHFKHNFLIHSSRLDNDEEYYRRHNYFHSQYGTVDKDTGEIISPPKKEFSFSWSRCRKSWSEVERHVFVDFGDENLFWVTSGMGTGYGRGRQISKENFLRKYGGDAALLETLIDKTK